MSSPAGAVVEGLIAVAGLVGSILGKVDDRPLFTTASSYTGLNGDMDALGRHPITRSNRYIDITQTLIVRDATREVAVASALGRQAISDHEHLTRPQ